MTDDRRRGPGWDERTKLGVQAESRSPHGVPLRRVTPATGIATLEERVTGPRVRVPPRPPTPEPPDELVPIDQDYESDKTGVTMQALQRAISPTSDLAPLIEPLAKILAGSRKHSATQAQLVTNQNSLVALVRDVLAREDDRAEADKERTQREREDRRRGRRTLYVSILGIIVPTLAAIAAIIAALHGAPAPAPVDSPRPVIR